MSITDFFSARSGAPRRHRVLASAAAVALLGGLVGGSVGGGANAAVQEPLPQNPAQSSISGEIEYLTVDNPDDHWSGGTITVGGQVVTIPRNLLIDLPANRLTLQELFSQAPAICQNGLNGTGETGLAKADKCNLTGTAGIATIAANRSVHGNAIAADIFIEKGVEAISGAITYINYDEGWFRINGNGNADTGVMVRLNDPDGRHTVQSGAGCAGGPNCSPDPRFTLDGDNYTNVFATGYPVCIPSTVSRTFVDTIGLGTTTAHANADGSGDVLCPTTNRTATGLVPNSHVFAPLQLKDIITVEGNFEIINGVRFLSAHSSGVADALETSPGQPDYLFLDEVEMDAGGFQNQRARALIIGYATLGVPSIDVDFWSIHYDPATNQPHEFPLASVAGCDIAAGAGTCGGLGLVGGAGGNIFKLRYDVDFLAGAKPRLNPCAQLAASPRFGPLHLCPNGGAGADASPSTLADQFAIMSPMPREIQARTGNSLNNPGLITLDIRGTDATNGQYLFPFGIGLGGVAFPEFNEINLDALGTPNFFTGLPWTMDRRLSPGGCLDANNDGIGECEPDAQPLSPYPYEKLDPRAQGAGLPTAPVNDPNFTATPLGNASNRIFSFVDPTQDRLLGNGGGTNATGNFNGDASLLAFPPAEPAAIPIGTVPTVGFLRAPLAPLPTITTLTPPSGPIGSTVTISGSDLTDASRVTFNGIPATFTVVDAHTISAVVPPGTETGPVRVTTIGGTGTSATDFVTAAPPTITGFTPLTGAVGSSVSISGTSFTGATAVKFGAVTATFQVQNDSLITATVPAGAGTGTISVTSADGVTGSSVDSFVATAPAPTITGFTPGTGPTGTSVTINGTSFTGATAVKFNGASATFTVVNDTSITATVPAGATTGKISVTTGGGGSVSSAINFTVTAAAPTIAGFTPTSGSVGTAVTITGTNFTGANAVSFNGTAATFSVNSATSITATVPIGATTGKISVTTPNGGTALSTGSFTFVPDVLAVTTATYRTSKGEWRIDGTSNILIPPGTITIYLGTGFSGRVIGTATVDIAGAWRFRPANGTVAGPGSVFTISVKSSNGGQLTGVLLTVRT